MSDFGFDAAALEQSMKDRWGKPAELEGILPIAELPPDPEPEPDPEEDELDLGLGEDEHEDDELTEPVVEPGVETPTTTPPAPTSSTSTPDLIDVGNGRFLTKDQIAYYADLDARFAQDAAFRNYLGQYGKQAPTPPKPPELPADLDLDDPSTKFLYDRMQEMERRLAQTGQVVTQTQQQQQEELANRTVSLVNRAAASFQKEHELTDDQLKALRISAAHIGGVDSYMSGVHPVTGDKIVNPDIMGAIDTALTIAFRAREDFVKESQEKVVRRQLDNKTRRTKLSKISGNSGSQPRTPQVPTDAPGRRAALLDEVRTLMNAPEA